LLLSSVEDRTRPELLGSILTAIGASLQAAQRGLIRNGENEGG
jgi:hypothetical protein